MLPNDLIRDRFLTERMIIGVMIIVGYFGIGAVAVFSDFNADQLQLTRDVLLTIGPLLGVIVNSIWRSDKRDEQAANTAAMFAEKLPTLTETSREAEPTPPPRSPLDRRP